MKPTIRHLSKLLDDPTEVEINAGTNLSKHFEANPDKFTIEKVAAIPENVGVTLLWGMLRKLGIPPEIITAPEGLTIKGGLGADLRIEVTVPLYVNGVRRHESTSKVVIDVVDDSPYEDDDE